MKKLWTIPLLIIALLGTAWAAPLGVSQRPKGISTPQIYDFSNGTPGDYYLDIPTLSANDTFCGLTTSQTLTNKIITTPVIASFYQDAAKTKLMTTPNTASDTLCAIAATQTLTNKTLTTPIIASFYQDAGKTQLMTAPDTASDTLCAIAATQTLTNKTMTTPVIASFYQDAGKTKLMTAPDTASDTLCAIAATQTLTNKTLTAPVIGSTVHAEASGTIGSADILQLNGTPKELIAAPDAGYAIIVDEIELFLDYGSAQYAADAGEDFTIQYATSNTAILSIDNDEDGVLLAAADGRRLVKPIIYNAFTTGALFDPDNADAEGIEATILVGEWLTGDSVLKYRISYRITPILS